MRTPLDHLLSGYQPINAFGMSREDATRVKGFIPLSALASRFYNPSFGTEPEGFCGGVR
jgi:hypothetical protein